jgi:uncharacterized protein YycO
MTIRLQFICGEDISSQAIAWFSQGHLSHVDAIMPDNTLLGSRSDSVGGQPPGVRIRPPDYAKFANRMVMTIPATYDQTNKFYDFLRSQLGKPYDTEAIWAFVINRNWREDDSWICSELQSAAGEQSGIVPPLYLATNKITPVACALMFSAIKGSTHVP